MTPLRWLIHAWACILLIAACETVGVVSGQGDGGLSDGDGPSGAGQDQRPGDVSATDAVEPSCAATCAGCCKPDGLCLQGTALGACGTAGLPCVDCSATGDQACIDGVCVAGCTPDCADKCAGAPDGCGGACPEAACSGCCTEDGSCAAGDLDQTCGVGGALCRDCTLNSQICGDGSCEGSCTPYCTNKCPGASDGCGGTCPSVPCSGCCTASESCVAGTADSNCGTAGESCQNCTVTGMICQSNACVCVPDCTNKCGGADDGCGGSCPTAPCSGCCSADGVCLPGTGNTACGAGGDPCENCSAEGLSCADADCICVPDCTNKCSGADDGCGGTCQQNDCAGCCSSTNECLGGSADLACGKGGAACVDCTPSGEECSGGSCACIPDCSNKCKNEDNGCGSPCPGGNHCNGCCNASNVCQPGELDTACGTSGDACVDCTLSTQACTNGKCI